MLKPGTDTQLIQEFRDKTTGDATRVFDLFTEWAKDTKRFECFPKTHGYMKSFRIMDDSAWMFSYAPNAKWVLFYFRNPCQRVSKYSQTAITNAFPDVQEKRSGELKIRVEIPMLAKKIIEFIER